MSETRRWGISARASLLVRAFRRLQESEVFRCGPTTVWSLGYTLIELMLVMMLTATISMIGVPEYMDALKKARVAQAIGDISSISKDIRVYQIFEGRTPAGLADVGWGGKLDPYGNPYRYLGFAYAKESNKWGGAEGGEGKPRRDRFLGPLNADFDLYSMGEDGLSRESLDHNESLDDIVFANDGGYIGLASEY